MTKPHRWWPSRIRLDPFHQSVTTSVPKSPTSDQVITIQSKGYKKGNASISVFNWSWAYSVQTNSCVESTNETQLFNSHLREPSVRQISRLARWRKPFQVWSVKASINFTNFTSGSFLLGLVLNCRHFLLRFDRLWQHGQPSVHILLVSPS